MAFNTRNPVEPNGSTDPRDLKDNAAIIDKLVNSSDLTWFGRLGKTLKTWAGMEQDFSLLLLNSGFESIHLVYVDGTPMGVERQTQLIDYNGSVYRVKLPASFPVALTGIWATDSAKLVDVSDLSLRQDLASATSGSGSDLVGHLDWHNQLTTVGQQLRLLSNNTIYADDPRFGGSIENAIAGLGNNMTLVIRQPYTTTKPLRIVGKTNAVVCCVGDGKLSGSRTNFTFPDSTARGLLHFVDCINPVAYKCKIKGARAIKYAPADPVQDGDAGIETLRCTRPHVIDCDIDEVMTWGVIHIQFTESKTNGNRITNMTRQSGIGHADGLIGECIGNYINYSGLYGIEVEGTNSRIDVMDNDISNCLAGVAVIANASNIRVCRNTISLCTRAVSVAANDAANTQTGVEVTGNHTYDSFYHYTLEDTRFVEVLHNIALMRVAGAYIPQVQSDHVVKLISDTTVQILSSGTLPVAGDKHQYTEGTLRTVVSASPISDPVFGNCLTIVYTEASAVIGVGSFFMRMQNFVGGNVRWAAISGDRNLAINLFNNSFSGNNAQWLELAGSAANPMVANRLKWRDNSAEGIGRPFVAIAGDTTALVNSSFVFKRGDLLNPPANFFFGPFLQKMGGFMIGEMRTAGMVARNKPIAFSTKGLSSAFRLVLSLQGSTKTASTGNAVVSVNGTGVATIPVAQLGGSLVKVDVLINTLAQSDTYVINLDDTFGDMGFASAVFELHTVES